VGAVVVTRGEQGSFLRRGGVEAGVKLDTDRSEIPVVKARDVVDPTGCGDAYRAGLLYAVHHGLPLETGARMGSLMGSIKVAEPGPQSIDISLAEFRKRFEEAFGTSF
jgi:adenosine kinase